MMKINDDSPSDHKSLAKIQSLAPLKFKNGDIF